MRQFARKGDRSIGEPERTGGCGVHSGMIASTEPITVTISHRLGRDVAKQRIDSGLESIRAEIAGVVRSMDYSWDEYRLNFRLSALMQTIAGQIEVFDDFVRVELNLPRLLHLMARNIVGRIESRAAALLEPPKGG